MIDKEIDEIKALDIFYASKTYTQLTDETTGSYKKTWQEVYEILKNEIKYK